MQVRTDIATAATRMTSGHDVHREIRQLQAYLRDREAVHRMVAGTYGPDSGLLVVTDQRVLLLRDGRIGQASEGFPLERVSIAEWVPDRASITISDSYSTAMLRDVSPTEGPEVVELIRALHGRHAGGGRRWASPDGSDLPSPALPRFAPAPGHQAAGQPPVQVAEPPRHPAAGQHVDTPGQPAASQPGQAPGQPAASQPGQAPGQPAASQPGEAPGQSAAVAPTAPAPEEPAAAHRPAEPPRRPVPPPPAPPSAAALTHGAVPVTLLAHTTMIPAQQHLERPSPPPPAGAMLAGEVPVRVLAAEATAGLGWRPVPAAGVAEMSVAELAAQPSPADGVEPEAEPAEAPGRRRPISWRPPPRTRTAPARAATSDSEAAPGSEPDEADVEALGARRDAPVAPRRRPKKWIWVSAGAAGLLALAGAGTALLVSAPGKPAATPVRPAPTAAIDTRVGPTVTVTKVLSPDTVEVTGGYSGTVSVLGILVPSADKAQCGATTAKSYASRRLTDARVTLITDPTQPPVDSSGNRLAFLRLKDGSDYSLDAVKAGMARSFDGQPPVQSAAALKAAEADAKRRGVGLWAAPCHGKFGSSPTSTGDTSASPTSSTSAGPTATATSGTGAATRSAGNPN